MVKRAASRANVDCGVFEFRLDVLLQGEVRALEAVIQTAESIL